ncbi:MAG: hypothetical protein GF388_11380 [Candidatus Aegiribacteria sp.]|nr:hypothetical protein [Candidatus Aegiribacteria sp.]MBD3295595.1 hypothetical protein [Candidatus Fermentibacteria bacterium]
MTKSILRAQSRAVLGRGAVLHASAAVVIGKGVLFLAPSGGGKSTTVRILKRRGFTILGDDSTIVSRGTDNIWRILPCASYEWSTGERPPPQRLHSLFLLEKGEPSLIRELTSRYTCYRILRDDSILACGDLQTEERPRLRRTVRLLSRDFPCRLLRWSNSDSLVSTLLENLE